MTIAEAIKDIQRIVGAKLAVLDIRQNWDPHQYIIGAKAAEWLDIHTNGTVTSDNVSNTERLLSAKCEADGCNLPFTAHKCETIVYLQCRANMSYNFALTRINAMGPYMSANGIDGYAFVSNKKGYKISEPKTKPS